MKHKKYLLLLIIPVLVLLISRTFSLTYTEEIKNVEIESNDYDQPGSWHIDKSAEWTGFGKARVTFDVQSMRKTIGGDYVDVVIVMDNSASMYDYKLIKAKQDAKEITEYLLADANNRVALITFNSFSQIKTGFTNNKNDVVNLIDQITDDGSTNYYVAFQNIQYIMQNYIKNDNRDLVVLFLTDGYPNEDTPNQVPLYAALKEKYPYMTINGIQYEMGQDIIQDIIDISDFQYVASVDTLNNVLFEVTAKPLSYEKFIITDYIYDEYFYVDSINDIEVPFGTVTIENENNGQKITWNLGDNYVTGRNVQMKINLKLKEAYHNTRGFYPTNLRETIVSKLPDESEKMKTSESTPVLANAHNVIYNLNTPTNCTLPTVPAEEHYAFQTVTIRNDNFTCAGYIFRGWRIGENETNDIEKINDSTFIMPAHDVIIGGTWTKQDMVKSMDGTVYEKTTLYKVFEKYANEGIYAQQYTNNHQDSYNGTGTNNIYYWKINNNNDARTVLDKNNVIFANHCWQMLRTTDTGGVKLIYNGEVEDQKCLNTRGNHVGYNNFTSTLILNGTYFYGTDYIYDKANNYFKLSGNIISAEVNSSNASTVINTLKDMYTCLKTSIDGTCTTLYRIRDYSSGTNAKAVSIRDNSHYSQYGEVTFNEEDDSLSDVGYMYNKRYEVKNYSPFKKDNTLSSVNQNGSYWGSDSVEWDPVTRKYKLVDPQQLSTSGATAQYSFFDTSETYSSSNVYYIVRYSGVYYYYVQLSNGADLSSYESTTFTYGDSYIDNGDGTYTVTNANGDDPTVITILEWPYNVYGGLLKKYMCNNTTNNTCTELKYLTATGPGSYTYLSVPTNYKFSNSFEYRLDNTDGTYKYYLNENDSVSFWNIIDEENLSKLNSRHYTCFNSNGVCSELAYVYRQYTYNNDTIFRYIYVEDAKTIETMVEEMLSLDNNSYHINTKDSLIKWSIEEWYKRNLYDDYDNYIEDVIYCNDRSIGEIAGWNSQNGSVNLNLIFKSASTPTDLYCNNETDQFSTLNNKAKLNYKIGLATIPEMALIGNDYYRKTNKGYNLMSPAQYHESTNPSAFIGNVNSSGIVTRARTGNVVTTSTYGLRPVISLKPGIEFSEGYGSMESPYVIDTSGN